MSTTDEPPRADKANASDSKPTSPNGDDLWSPIATQFSNNKTDAKKGNDNDTPFVLTGPDMTQMRQRRQGNNNNNINNNNNNNSNNNDNNNREADSKPLGNAAGTFSQESSMPSTFGGRKNAFDSPLLSHSKSRSTRSSYTTSSCTTDSSSYRKHSRRSYKEDNMEETDTMSQCTLDSFENLIFHPLYPPPLGDDAVLGDVPPQLDVPWELRDAFTKYRCTYFDFLGTKEFWFLIQYALRITLIGMLVPAALIAAELPHTPFISTSYALSCVVIAAGVTVGHTVSFFVQYVKAGCIWLPIATICVAIRVQRSLAAWFIVYVALLFLMAVYTERTVRRMCLLLFNVALVSLLTGNDSLVLPSRILADWAIGAGFAVAATVLPYPLLATREAERTSNHLFRNVATTFRGMSTSFWVTSNTERSMRMVRIRYLNRVIDELHTRFATYDSVSLYELFIFEKKEYLDVRRMKVKLLEALRLDTRTMIRAIDMAQEQPNIIDQSPRCVTFGLRLSSHMEGISSALEKLFLKLGEAQSRNDLVTLDGCFDVCAQRVKGLQDEFDVARRDLLYGEFDGSLEAYIPLMTFFVFAVVSFGNTMRDFQAQINRFHPKSFWESAFLFFTGELKDSFVSCYTLTKSLILYHQEAELRVVLEAAKVSVAMLISVIFFYYVDHHNLLLSGPTIIAFVSGTNPVEAFQASVARLMGTIMGSVLGFFAESLSNSNVDIVASLCTITFVMTFFRSSTKFGVMCMYCNFVATSNLTITTQTAAMIISRMQQNAFAIFIYCFISVAIFPLRPSKVLMKKRCNVLFAMSRSLKRCMMLYHDSANQVNNASMSNDALMELPTEDDTSLDGLFVEVDKMFAGMKDAQGLMDLAADEVSFDPGQYPRLACQLIQISMYRSCALVRAMACSWKMLRYRGYFSKEAKAVMSNLAPVAADVAASFQRFVNLLTFYLKHPSSALSPELARSSVEVRSLCEELLHRNSHNLLMVIGRTLESKGLLKPPADSKETDTSSTGSSSSSTGSSPCSSCTSMSSGSGPRRRGRNNRRRRRQRSSSSRRSDSSATSSTVTHRGNASFKTAANLQNNLNRIEAVSAFHNAITEMDAATPQGTHEPFGEYPGDQKTDGSGDDAHHPRPRKSTSRGDARRTIVNVADEDDGGRDGEKRKSNEKSNTTSRSNYGKVPPEWMARTQTQGHDLQSHIARMQERSQQFSATEKRGMTSNSYLFKSLVGHRPHQHHHRHHHHRHHHRPQHQHRNATLFAKQGGNLAQSMPGAKPVGTTSFAVEGSRDNVHGAVSTAYAIMHRRTQLGGNLNNGLDRGDIQGYSSSLAGMQSPIEQSLVMYRGIRRGKSKLDTGNVDAPGSPRKKSTSTLLRNNSSLLRNARRRHHKRTSSASSSMRSSRRRRHRKNKKKKEQRSRGRNTSSIPSTRDQSTSHSPGSAEPENYYTLAPRNKRMASSMEQMQHMREEAFGKKSGNFKSLGGSGARKFMSSDSCAGLQSGQESPARSQHSGLNAMKHGVPQHSDWHHSRDDVRRKGERKRSSLLPRKPLDASKRSNHKMGSSHMKASGHVDFFSPFGSTTNPAEMQQRYTGPSDEGNSLPYGYDQRAFLAGSDAINLPEGSLNEGQWGDIRFGDSENSSGEPMSRWQLQESFTLPLNVHDAEGLHTLALCLEMLGREMKKSLLYFEDMVQRNLDKTR